jgi:hypothetical protein
MQRPREGPVKLHNITMILPRPLQVDKVVVLWTANTERYSEVVEGMNDTPANLLAAIQRNESEVSPSTLYATACVLEGVPFVNGSPQNTFVPGLIEMAVERNVLIGAWVGRPAGHCFPVLLGIVGGGCRGRGLRGGSGGQRMSWDGQRGGLGLVGGEGGISEAGELTEEPC